MTPKEVFALIKGKVIKRYRQTQDEVQIEFEDLSILTISLDGVYEDKYLGAHVFVPGGYGQDWLE